MVKKRKKHSTLVVQIRCLKCKRPLDAQEPDRGATCPDCGWINVISNTFNAFTVIPPLTRPHADNVQYCYPELFLGPAGKAEFEAMEENIQKIVVEFLNGGWETLTKKQKVTLYRIRANAKFAKLLQYYTAKTNLHSWLAKYPKTGK